MINIPNNGFGSIKKLNDEFEVIKKYLEAYLLEEFTKLKKMDSYALLFKLMNSKNTAILNFNYTDTVKKYLTLDLKSQLIQIHGELNSEKNPIIFGYAANDEESRDLLDKEDNEYMRNIKKHNYKRTSSENQLIEYLDNTKEIDIHILGHSCGISDKLILNQVLNHKNVNSIRVYYYKGHESYFNAQVNIDRIMNNDKNFKKLVNFQECVEMPQYNREVNGFDEYIEGIVERQKKDFNSRTEVYYTEEREVF